MISTAWRAVDARSSATSCAIQQSTIPSLSVYITFCTSFPRSVEASMPKVDSAMATPFSFMNE